MLLIFLWLIVKVLNPIKLLLKIYYNHMIRISLLALNPGYHLGLLIMKFFHLVIRFIEEIILMVMEGYSLAVIVVIHVHTLIFKQPVIYSIL